MRMDSVDVLCCPACKGNLQLTAENRNEVEIADGTLDCSECKRQFDIDEGLPNLIFPDTLEESDLQNKIYHDQHPDYSSRRWALRLGIWIALWDTRARRHLIDKLELKKNASLLETGVGTGANLFIIANLIGKYHRLDGIDISLETLKVARRKMKAAGIHVELACGNAAWLPYRDERYDGVLHVGALNQIGDKKRAIEEMVRVSKPGAKVIMCDEGLAPGKENTWHGRWILRRDPVLFANKPPVEFLPGGIRDLRVYWVWQKTFWVIEFRKQEP